MRDSACRYRDRSQRGFHQTKIIARMVSPRKTSMEAIRVFKAVEEVVVEEGEEARRELGQRAHVEHNQLFVFEAFGTPENVLFGLLSAATSPVSANAAYTAL